MKILVISARYPPHHLGGYGLRIKDVADGLSVRGHTIWVITTNDSKKSKTSAPDPTYPVLRRLHNRNEAGFFPKEIFFDLLDTKFLEQQIKAFQPDLIYLGHIYVLSKALIPYLAGVDIPIVLDEGGASLKGAWTEHGRWFRFTGDYGQNNPLIRAVKPLLTKLVCWLSRGRITPDWVFPGNIIVFFNNETNHGKVKTLGVPIQNARVIHSGVDTDLFKFKPRAGFNSPIKVVYPARIERLKGHLDAIHLVKHLHDVGTAARLIIVGPVFSEDYFHELTHAVRAENIIGLVQFLPMVTQEELVSLYQGSDICVFPSYHKMGFSRVPLEAMACGCVVISYGNEGTGEIIQDHQTGFIIAENDLHSMSQVVKKLSEDPILVSTVSQSARKQIEAHFTMGAYVSKIDSFLLSAVEDGN